MKKITLSLLLLFSLTAQASYQPLTNLGINTAGGVLGLLPVSHMTLNNSLVPSSTGAFDLGSVSHFWNNIYFNDGAIFQPCPNILSPAISDTTCLEIPYTGNSHGLSIFTASNGTADANGAGNISIVAGNKTAGTGGGGNLFLSPGTSVGGPPGVIFTLGSLMDVGSDLEVDGVLDLSSGGGINYADGVSVTGDAPREHPSGSIASINLAAHPIIFDTPLTASVVVETFCFVSSVSICSVAPAVSLTFSAAGALGGTLIASLTTPLSGGLTCATISSPVTVPAGQFLVVNISAGTCTNLQGTATIGDYTN